MSVGCKYEYQNRNDGSAATACKSQKRRHMLGHGWVFADILIAPLTAIIIDSVAMIA
jgi:hypothetical protein